MGVSGELGLAGLLLRGQVRPSQAGLGMQLAGPEATALCQAAPRPLVSRALLMDEAAAPGRGRHGPHRPPSQTHINSPSPPINYLFAPASEHRFG